MSKSLDDLQPEIRQRAVVLLDSLQGSPHNWKLGQTYRAASGKCGVADAATSKTDPCVNPSLHSYGAAFHVLPNGKWGGPWNDDKWPGWDELQAEAAEHGLRAGLVTDAGVLWDRAHVQWSVSKEARHEVVRWLQRDLGVDADGVWGPQTDMAARAAAVDLGVVWRDPVPTYITKINPLTYRELRAALRGETIGGGIVGGALLAVVVLAVIMIRRG